MTQFRLISFERDIQAKLQKKFPRFVTSYLIS